MTFFVQQSFIGLATGSIYAALALALVLIYRSTGVINFAQGEMATLSAYIVWLLMVGAGWALAPAVIISVLASAGLGALLYLLIVRRASRTGDFLQIATLTIALYLFISSMNLSLWSGIPKEMPAIFGKRNFHVFGANINESVLGVMIVSAIVLLVIAGFFGFTKAGLGLQAATFNPVAARIVGIEPSRMYLAGWALAAVVGAAAGILSTSLFLLEPTMMVTPMILAFAAVSLGGLRSPLGAVIGGLFLGLCQSLLGAFVLGGLPLQTPLAFLLLVGVLLVKPNGIFGVSEVESL